MAHTAAESGGSGIVEVFERRGNTTSLSLIDVVSSKGLLNVQIMREKFCFLHRMGNNFQKRLQTKFISNEIPQETMVETHPSPNSIVNSGFFVHPSHTFRGIVYSEPKRNNKELRPIGCDPITIPSAILIQGKNRSRSHRSRSFGKTKTNYPFKCATNWMSNTGISVLNFTRLTGFNLIRCHLTQTADSSTPPQPRKPLNPGPLPTPKSHSPQGRPVSPSVRISSSLSDAFPSYGPAFMGQVFAVVNKSSDSLVGLKPWEEEDLPLLFRKALKPAFKFLGLDFNKFINDMKTEQGPMFHFFFDKKDAGKHVHRLMLETSGSLSPGIGSLPLDEAYKWFKSQPSMFKFMANSKQLSVARSLLRKMKGRKAADSFSEVPVFTATNLTIAMATPKGIRWLTPYFFNKRQLDDLLSHSVDSFYQELIQVRRLQRHSQLTDGGDGLGEGVEDDPDSGLMDPPEVADFMEEMGHEGAHTQSAMAKVVEVLSQDCVDSVMLGNKWGRKLAGLEPSHNVIVDSFRERAALAEAAAFFESKGLSPMAAWVQSRMSSTASAESGSEDAKVRGLGEESSSSSSSDGALLQKLKELLLDESSSSSAATSAKKDEGTKSWGLPQSLSNQLDRVKKACQKLDLFGEEVKQKRRGGLEDWGGDVEEREKIHEKGQVNRGEDSESKKTNLEPWQIIQPKLTMLGVAIQGPESSLSDTSLQEALVAAAKDFEEKVKKGDIGTQNHGPLFIADLGQPTTFGNEVPRSSSSTGAVNGS